MEGEGGYLCHSQYAGVLADGGRTDVNLVRNDVHRGRVVVRKPYRERGWRGGVDVRGGRG